MKYTDSISYALLTKDIRKVKLTKEELTQMHLEYFETKSAVLKEKLITYHLRYLITIVNQFKTSKNVPTEDMIAYGSIALVKCLEAYDPTTGFAFTSFMQPAVIRELISCVQHEEVIRKKSSSKQMVDDGILPQYTYASTADKVGGIDEVSIEDTLSDDTFDKLFDFDELTETDKVNIFWDYLKELLPKQDQWELMRAKYSATTANGKAIKLTDLEIGEMFGTTKANIGQKKLNIMIKIKKDPKLYKWYINNFMNY